MKEEIYKQTYYTDVWYLSTLSHLVFTLFLLSSSLSTVLYCCTAVLLCCAVLCCTVFPSILPSSSALKFYKISAKHYSYSRYEVFLVLFLLCFVILVLNLLNDKKDPKISEKSSYFSTIILL